MIINYHNRKFRIKSASENSELPADTVFHYHQKGNIVYAQYSGGDVEFGQLLGAVDENGKIDMRYHQISKSGIIMTGKCKSTPAILENGKIILKEEWQWTSGDLSSGVSELEEI